MNALKNALIGRLVPFLAWLPELKNGETLRADIIAGITVALVLIPQSMAYAQLAGLPAYYGLYAAFMPPMVAAIFGSSRQLATGPVAVVSLMTAAALEPLATAGGAAYIAYAILLSLMVGLFQLSLGLLRLGVLVNFLSHPVVVGFTNAAAIIIATSQLSKIFGVSVEKAEHHYETVWNVILTAIDKTHWPTFAMAVLAFAIMIILKRINKKIPNVLVAVAITTVLAWAIGFQQLQDTRIEQIHTEQVRTAMATHWQHKQAIADLSEQILAAEKTLAESLDSHGPNSRDALSARHEVEALRLQREQLKNDAKTNEKTLKGTVLVAAAGSEDSPAMFYAADSVPAGVGVTEAQWKVSKFAEDGSVVMHSGGKVVGSIPSGLPAPKMPALDWGIMLQLLAAAITISLLGFMEAISIAKAMAARTRQRLDANQELIGQGLGNIAGSIFQSYPTSGSFSRSAVNIEANAVTGFSSVVTSLVVVITLLFFTPLLYHLPQATLAAVIMMAVAGLIKVAPIVHAWHACRHDGVVAVITFVLTLAFAPHLDKGIMIGVGLSLMLYLYRTMKPRVVFLSRDKDGLFKDAEQCEIQGCDEIGVLRFEGSLYFANISYFENKVQEMLADKPKLKFLVVECVSINQMDASGEELLRETAKRLKDAGVEALFTRVKTPIFEMLKHTGFVVEHGTERFFRKPELALDYIADKMGPDYAKKCPLMREAVESH